MKKKEEKTKNETHTMSLSTNCLSRPTGITRKEKLRPRYQNGCKANHSEYFFMSNSVSTGIQTLIYWFGHSSNTPNLKKN